MTTVRQWQAILQKLRNSWVQMSRIFSREGADPKVLGHFFKALVQAVLLFGGDAWVLTPWVERALSSFQHRVVWQLTGRQTQWQGGGGGVSSAGGNNFGSRIRGDWGLCHEEVEYGCAIYFSATNSGPLWTVCLEAVSVGVSAVVGAGSLVPGGGKGDNSDRVGRRRGEIWVGNGAGRDSGPGMRMGLTKVAISHYIGTEHISHLAAVLGCTITTQ